MAKDEDLEKQLKEKKKQLKLKEKELELKEYDKKIADLDLKLGKKSRQKIKLPQWTINILMLVFGLIMLIVSQGFTGWITLGFALCGVFMIIVAVKGGIVPRKEEKKAKKPNSKQSKN